MSAESFLGGRAMLCCGDSIHFMRDQPDNRYDSIVCDPPYALVSIVKRFGSDSAAAANGDVYKRSSAGFMGKKWDTGDSAHDSEFWREALRVLKPGGYVLAFAGTRTYHRLACAIEDAGFEIRDMISWLYGSGFPKSHNAGNGWGTALKPACEPICMARKPLSEGTVAANVLKWGTGAINVDGCRVGYQSDADMRLETRGVHNSTKSYDGLSEDGGAFGGLPAGRTIAAPNNLGRWPANLIHDGSEEVVAGFPETASNGQAQSFARGESAGYGYKVIECEPRETSSGSASRFFYTAKADSDDRLGSKHPTVKPVYLMQYLVRLVTPKGGLVLDPFAGTGTTAEACFREGMSCAMVERELEYQADIRRRMALVMAGPQQRSHESIKAEALPVDHGPLFHITKI